MRLPFFVDLPNSQRGRRSGWVSMTPQGTANLFRWTGRSLAFLGIKTKSFKKIKFIVCHDTRGWVVSVHAKTYSTACVRVRTTLQNLDRLTLSRRPCAINQIPMSDWLPFHFPINGNFRSAAALFVLYALRSFLLFTILFLFPYTVITWTRRFIFPVLALLSPDPDPLSPCGRGSSRIRPMLVLVAREGSPIATIRSW
ncbi:hypothetical protein BKA83DRAFT_2181781 [Pisolithus microcarpus]|nr:hypothetical protein BKA83DRAFT_2181781 [Pisolithus microcarpus]